MLWHWIKRILYIDPCRGKYVVAWWPDNDKTMPEIAGPFASMADALAMRSRIRVAQNRESNIAQIVVLNGGLDTLEDADE